MQKGSKDLLSQSPAAWQKWLEKSHLSEQALWLVFYNESSDEKSMSWGDPVDVALCFGWVDSKKIKIYRQTSHQFYSN